MTDTCNIDSDFNELPSEDEICNMVNVFKAISDPTRLCILYLLEDTELCSCRIQEALNNLQQYT